MSDLDVQIGRLDERLKSLEKKQDEHHNTILTTLEDLKNGYAHRLDMLEKKNSEIETYKFSKVDFTNYRNTQVVTDDKLDTRITWLERIAYGALAIIAFIEFYFRIIK